MDSQKLSDDISAVLCYPFAHDLRANGFAQAGLDFKRSGIMTCGQHIAELCGSIFEIAGTFLLAVEAIKLENLKKVREKIFQKAIRTLSPRIHVTKAEEQNPETMKTKKETATNRASFIIFFVGIVAELAFIWERGWSYKTALQSLANETHLPPTLGLAVAVLVAFCWLFGFGSFLGVVLYYVALTPFKFLSNTLEWIELHTENGTIGILGFFVFLVGAIIHAYISWNVA